MRILLLTVIVFIVIHTIRFDFVEGTIPKTVVDSTEETCQEETKMIAVTSVYGDTIESLFALYPDPEMSFIDRLTLVYSFNPHLKQQSIVANEEILLPISGTSCITE